MTLDAGYNFANNTITAGTGNIFLNGGSGQTGTGSIQTGSGSINLAAGSGIQMGSGAELRQRQHHLAGGRRHSIWRRLANHGWKHGAVTLEAGVNNFTTRSIDHRHSAGNIFLNGGLTGDRLAAPFGTAAG